MQLFEENGYSVKTLGGNKLEEETLKKALDNISEEEFTKRLTEGFEGYSLGTDIEKPTFNKDTNTIDSVESLLQFTSPGARSYNLVKSIRPYSLDAWCSSLNVEHPFYTLCQKMSKHPNWVNNLLESEDLYKIISSLDASESVNRVLNDYTFFNNASKEEIRLRLVGALRRHAESESCYAKELIFATDDPIKKYTETFLICHALACGTNLGNRVFHEEHMDHAKQILEHFGFVDNGRYNIEKIVKIIEELSIVMRDYFGYGRDELMGKYQYLMYIFLHKLYRDDKYLEETRVVLNNVIDFDIDNRGRRPTRKIQLASFMIHTMRESVGQLPHTHSMNVVNMIISFIPKPC